MDNRITDAIANVMREQEMTAETLASFGSLLKKAANLESDVSRLEERCKNTDAAYDERGKRLQKYERELDTSRAETEAFRKLKFDVETERGLCRVAQAEYKTVMDVLNLLLRNRVISEKFLGSEHVVLPGHEGSAGGYSQQPMVETKPIDRSVETEEK